MAPAEDNCSLTVSQERAHSHMGMWVTGSHKTRALGAGGKTNCGIPAVKAHERKGSFLLAKMTARQVNLLPDPDAATSSSEQE